ncbi:MAG: hypothetical protein ACKPKO_02100, partial [Candidatus Fonsibacter sp.]
RTLRDASVALALTVVVEDSVYLHVSQFLHVLYNSRHLVWLVSSTAQLKEGNHDIADDAENHLY